MGRSTVYEVARRFREQGEAGLVDHREENGERKLDEWYLAVLYFDCRIYRRWLIVKGANKL